MKSVLLEFRWVSFQWLFICSVLPFPPNFLSTKTFQYKLNFDFIFYFLYTYTFGKGLGVNDKMNRKNKYSSRYSLG